MSWSRESTVWCDHSECSEWHQGAGTVADVREEARRCGWTRRDGTDLCREHSARAEGT